MTPSSFFSSMENFSGRIRWPRFRLSVYSVKGASDHPEINELPWIILIHFLIEQRELVT